MAIRRQLTLFVPQKEAELIEAIRLRFNPLQYDLIKCHVTLCREHELTDLTQIIENIRLSPLRSIRLGFGKPVRFANGKGVLLPAVSGLSAFRQLRELILKGVVKDPGEQEPHITLMHPRNASCMDADFAFIEKAELPQTISFSNISLIEQSDSDPWKLLQSFDLAADM